MLNTCLSLFVLFYNTLFNFATPHQSCFSTSSLSLLPHLNHFYLFSTSSTFPKACSLLRAAITEEGSSEYQTRDLLILPLYSSLSSEAQQRAFQKPEFYKTDTYRPPNNYRYFLFYFILFFYFFILFYLFIFLYPFLYSSLLLSSLLSLLLLLLLLPSLLMHFICYLLLFVIFLFLILILSIILLCMCVCVCVCVCVYVCVYLCVCVSVCLSAYLTFSRC